MQKSRVYLFLLPLSLLLLLGAVFLNRQHTFVLEDVALNAGRQFSVQARKCKKALSSLSADHQFKAEGELVKLYEEEKIGIYIFKHDSLVYWNNSQLPLQADARPFSKEQGFVKLNHGFYIYFRKGEKNDYAVALCLVKPLYALQNNYLRNDFADWTGIPKEIEIDTLNPGSGAVFMDRDKLFSLKGNEKLYYSGAWDQIGSLVFTLGFLGSLISLLLLLVNDPSTRKMFFLISFVLLVRALMIFFKWPDFFYRSVLFDLRLFGNARSFANGYLGDILLNSFVFLFMAVAFYFCFNFSEKKKNNFITAGILLVFLFLLMNQFNHVVTSLVSNSTLSFDFLSVFNIRFPAFAGLTALGIYSLALFVAVNKFISFFSAGRWPGFLKFTALILLLCFIHQMISQSTGYFESYWLLLFSIPLFFLNRSNASISLSLGLQILIISLVTSRFLNYYIDKNQQQDLEILSVSLSERQDPILQSEFAGIPEKIFRDENFKNLIDMVPDTEKEIVASLKQKFFAGYFDRYNLDFSLFDANCNPLITPRQPVLMNQGYFEDQIKINSDSVLPGLYFVKNYRKNSQYIGRIKLKEKNLFVLMEPKQFEELGSFPDLLLDQSLQKQEKLKNFSYAVYRSQQNTNRYGSFNYPYFLEDSTELAGSDQRFVHHYFRPDELTQVIVSRDARTWNYFFTFNSYLLLFFSVITYCSYWIFAAFFTAQFKNSSLTRRIQTIIILLLLLAMSAVGITSGELVSGQFETENKKQLREKTDIIVNELNGQFLLPELFDGTQKELVNLKLKEFSRLFNTPISLFNKGGFLFNTSEPKLYDFGLAASLANPVAFRKLRENRVSTETVNERAGTLNYLSLYTPLFDADKQLMGFINLPYFARQSDLVSELSGIISALINVYVILFVLSIVAGLILSGYITQPLRLIKQQIANITLGKQNEKISWQSNDEIGKLVAEYNQMLVKLEDSANLLAQNERESAWREMAKQVAHEIKNPLTPMKLNLQYLQHLMKNDSNDFREKFEKASAGIIEQIDSLANIANEFSNFAKFPGTSLQTINLVELINTSVLIFENQKNFSIKNLIAEKEILVKGDRDQCLRVFNNILKNAVQALDGIENPQITIVCQQSDSRAVISIRDNGCGIDEELKPKIFTPNFTTKTTGSGLGLAMVKNIMDGFGGKIWFESENGKGTTFYLEFEKVNLN